VMRLRISSISFSSVISGSLYRMPSAHILVTASVMSMASTAFSSGVSFVGFMVSLVCGLFFHGLAALFRL